MRNASLTFTAFYLGILSLAAAPSYAGSSIGDGGHFIVFSPTLYLNNPAGKAFTVTVHRHIWDTDFGNKGTYQVHVTAPSGQNAAEGTITTLESRVTMAVPEGEKGVYRVTYKPGGYALTWVESSLDQMVVGSGDWNMANGPYSNFTLHVMAPRRWYFYVPAGVKRFSVKHTIMPFQSHREDYGFLVMSPRGQRVAAFYGGKSVDVGYRLPDKPNPIVQEIEVDEGAAGHFWSIWATGGDSHNFSDLPIQLDGVPPYFAPSPEQWFDPSTGTGPARLVYDDAQIRMLDRECKTNAQGRLLSRDHYLWTPTPFLGDEDYNGMQGPHTIYLDNPSNRPLDVGVATYVVNEKERLPVTYRVLGPDGRLAIETHDTYSHHSSSRLSIPSSGAGVYRVDVDASEWIFWMEPVVRAVLAGEGDGASRFRLQVGIARHWFFRVPQGVHEFTVRVAVTDPAHVLSVEVHAPDRLMEPLYVRGGEPRTVTIRVPDGLDNHIWFLRTEVGSATRFVSEAPRSASSRLRISADIDLQGVPGYLAPTWEQWFEPKP